MDPRNGPAWIAFAHTFAFEGEHEQAVTAYSTCARLFRGSVCRPTYPAVTLICMICVLRSHLPLLYVGMEYLRMANLPLAEEYFNAAYKICDTDPLLLNEIGVLNYHTEK
jgi:anaphase-promoting complex subunit 6